MHTLILSSIIVIVKWDSRETKNMAVLNKKSSLFALIGKKIITKTCKSVFVADFNFVQNDNYITNYYLLLLLFNF